MAKSKIIDRPLVNDVNCQTGETTVRPMTDEEFAAYNEATAQ